MKNILPLLLFFVTVNVSALELRSAFVYTEAMAEGHRKCQLSTDSLVASVESALRANRISIRTDRGEPYFYVNANALEVESNFCVLNLKLEVQFYARVPVSFLLDKKSIFATVALCQEEMLLTGQKHNLQSRANTALKEFVDLCLSRMSKIR